MKNSENYADVIKELNACKEKLSAEGNKEAIANLDSAITLLESEKKSDRVSGWKKALPYLILVSKDWVKKTPKAIQEWLEENPEVIEAIKYTKALLGIEL